MKVLIPILLGLLLMIVLISSNLTSTPSPENTSDIEWRAACFEAGFVCGEVSLVCKNELAENKYCVESIKSCENLSIKCGK